MKYFIGLGLLLVFLAFGLFRELPSLYFFSDDFVWLLDAKRDTAGDLTNYFFQANGFFYRPITKLYFWNMWHVFQDTAYWYHLVNILVHFTNSILAYILSVLLLRRIMTRSYSSYAIQAIAIGSAVLFFVHSVHLENIVWPSAITELIPALVTLAALSLLVWMIENKRQFPIPIIFLLFIVGLGAHEYMVVFPVLAYLTHLFLELSGKKTMNKKIFATVLHEWRFLYLGFIAAEIGYFVLRTIANSHWSGGDYSYNLLRLPFNIIGNLLGYLGLLTVGIPFIDWYLQARFFLREQLLLAGMLLLVGLVVLFILIRLIWKYRKSRNFYFSLYLLLFFVVTLAPFLGLGGLAERYLYLPSFSLILLFSYGIYVVSKWIEHYTEAIAELTAYFLLIGMSISFFSYSIIQDIESWRSASIAVASRLSEFKNDCEGFSEGDVLVRSSPVNRLGRAWVFQVGYEEGANLYCDKNLQILRK